MEHDFLGLSSGKGFPFLPNKVFQNKIYVSFLQSQLLYQFQAFAVIFW